MGKDKVEKRMKKLKWIPVFLLLFVLILPDISLAAPLEISFGDPLEGGTPSTIWLILMLTVLSIAPAFLLLTTSFTRLAVVFSFMRDALGTQQNPPNQVLLGLALFLTIFIMAPVFSEVNDNAIQPFLNEEIEQKEALEAGIIPIRSFMLANTRTKDLSMFMNLSQQKDTEVNQLPITTVIPAFVISELRTAFQIGFLLFIPFIVIDMVVASILMSMGMFMLPPVMISIPFKILLFVLVDGWYLIVQSLVQGFS